MAQDRPLKQIPETMIQEDGKAVKERGEQAMFFAHLFQKKIDNITMESKIENDIFIGHRLLDVEDGEIFNLQTVLSAMADIKAKNSYGYDNIPM